MFIEQAEMIDKVVKDIDVRDLVSYLQMNYEEYTDRLLDCLEQEELIRHTEHIGQSSIDVVDGQLVLEEKETEILL